MHRPLLSRLAAAPGGAAALLATATALFAAVTVTGPNGIASGCLQAGAAGAIIGGAASWFTATAQFRRPPGLAVPHTTVPRTPLPAEHTDQLAAALGNFVRSGSFSADPLRSGSVPLASFRA